MVTSLILKKKRIIVYQIEKKAKEVNSVAVLLYLVTIIILLIAVFCVMNTLIIKIDSQKKFSEMLLKIGYKKNIVSFVYILENMIVTTRTAIYAFMTALILSVGMDAYLYKGYQAISSRGKYVFLVDPQKSCLFLIGIIFLIAVITAAVSFAQLKRIGRTITNGR